MNRGGDEVDHIPLKSHSHSGPKIRLIMASLTSKPAGLRA